MRQLSAAVVALWCVALSPAGAAAQLPRSVCIAMPQVRIVQGDAAAAAIGLRDMFATYLTGPSLTSVLLDSPLLSQAREEAMVKHCERILVVSLEQQRKGGSRVGQIVGSAAGDAIWYVPGGSTTASAVGRVAVITGARALTTISSGTKAKDQITLRYQLDGADGKALLPPMTEKLKAREDGEDLVTPLVTKASEAVVAAIK